MADIHFPTPCTESTPPIQALLCIPDDQRRYVTEPFDQEVRLSVLPRQGEIVYCAGATPWGVAMVIHDLRGAGVHRVQVWLEHLDLRALLTGHKTGGADADASTFAPR